MAKSEQVEISVLPKLTETKAKQLDEVVKAKSHLEYLCFMMLQELDKKASLKRILEIGIERNIVDDDAVREFFGEDGCGAAEGHTIPSLLKEWRDTTEKMMGLIR